jgi:hypothetical protein
VLIKVRFLSRPTVIVEGLLVSLMLAQRGLITTIRVR